MKEIMRREVLQYPAPILHQKAKPVKKVDEDIRALMDDMTETMYAEDGVGIAAPQVGVSLRVAVLDISGCKGDTGLGVIRMVNPEIIGREGDIEWDEGCLSVPEFRAKMQRSANVKVKYLDENGDPKELDATGLLAVAIQQEIDHLDGKLIIDTASPLKQDMYLKKIKKLSEE